MGGSPTKVRAMTRAAVDGIGDDGVESSAMHTRGCIPVCLVLAGLGAAADAHGQRARPPAMLSSVAAEAKPVASSAARVVAALTIRPADVPARLGAVPRPRTRWSRRVLRARPGETFAPVADCRTAIEGAAETIYNFERVADGYVWGHAPAPPRVVPPTSDGVSYERRCGQARVINPRGMNARADLDARLSWLEALQRSDAPAPGTSTLGSFEARSVIGSTVFAALTAMVFGYNNTRAMDTRRRGIHRWRVDPFVLGGGVGMTAGGALY